MEDKSEVMVECTLVDYNENMLAEMMQLFYDTVHEVCARDYNEKQLERWAPHEPDVIIWKQRLNNNLCKVAFINEVLVGFAELTEDAHVDTLYVHKDFQRQGIARELYNELLHLAINHQMEQLTTEASITAKPFFESRGFTVTNVKTKLYNGKEFINYEMQKQLS
jgi:putative acetyltransferase